MPNKKIIVEKELKQRFFCVASLKFCFGGHYVLVKKWKWKKHIFCATCLELTMALVGTKLQESSALLRIKYPWWHNFKTKTKWRTKGYVKNWIWADVNIFFGWLNLFSEVSLNSMRISACWGLVSLNLPKLFSPKQFKIFKGHFPDKTYKRLQHQLKHMNRKSSDIITFLWHGLKVVERMFSPIICRNWIFYENYRNNVESTRYQ